MSEVSKSLIVTFDALNLVKGIKSIGGPDKQVYYIESNIFAPDRRITPLILQPYILVEDPHEIIASGDKVGELSSAKWYFDEIKSENRITAKEESASIDTPFALGANNSLHIRKNVEKAIQLFFEAEYLDIRKNKNINITLTYLLTTTQSSEVKPAPKLKLSKPQSWKYCPLDKATEATIEAEVFADNKGYKSAVEWCKVEGDKVTPLSNEPFVLGGQNTDKLKVNPSLMKDSLILARNLSEADYNKAYGINPDWDDKMSEVFENRNKIVNSKLTNNKTLESTTGKIIDTHLAQVTEYYITIPNNDNTFSALRKEGVKNGLGTYVFDFFRIVFYDIDKKYISNIELDKKNSPFTGDIPSTAKFIRLSSSRSDLENIKFNFGVSTNYTPAPEDLSFQNIAVDALKNTTLYSCKADKEQIINNIKFFTNLVYEGDTGNNLFFVLKRFYLEGKPTGYKFTLSFKLIADKDTPISLTANNIKYTLVSNPSVKSGVEYKFVAFMEIANSGASHYNTHIAMKNKPTNIQLYDVFIHEHHVDVEYQPTPYDIAPDGIIPGEYQSDIKFTKYFPEINAEILFLTGDSIRPEHKTVKAQAIFTTNKEPITNPSEFFDIEWFIDPIEAGGVPKQIGTGEFMEIPVSDLQLKGGRLVPIRLKYNFK